MDKAVAEVLTTNIHKVSILPIKKLIAHLVSTDGIQAIPVVDAQGRTNGIVTADDVIDALREMGTRDMQKVGGVGSLGRALPETGFLALRRKRTLSRPSASDRSFSPRSTLLTERRPIAVIPSGYRSHSTKTQRLSSD